MPISPWLLSIQTKIKYAGEYSLIKKELSTFKIILKSKLGMYTSNYNNS